MKECFKKVKNIFAICWGMQVAVTAAGGVVRKSKNGAHIGIAKNIKINSEGLKHPIYKDKKSLFNTPAFNFDEVETLPKGTTLLSSNPVNNVQGNLTAYLPKAVSTNSINLDLPFPPPPENISKVSSLVEPDNHEPARVNTYFLILFITKIDFRKFIISIISEES